MTRPAPLALVQLDSGRQGAVPLLEHEPRRHRVLHRLTKKCAPARLAAAVRRTLERVSSGRCEPWLRRASPEYCAAALSPPRTRALRTLDRKSTPLARPARRATLGRRRA